MKNKSKKMMLFSLVVMLGFSFVSLIVAFSIKNIPENISYVYVNKKGSFANVGVVKSICKQVQTAAYQGSNHGISATGGFTSHGYSCRNRVSFVN